MSRVVQISARSTTGTSMSDHSRDVHVSYAGFGRLRYEEGQRVLFVLRESSLSAEHELASLASIVLGRHDYRSGVAELIDAGVTPLREPSRWSGKRLAEGPEGAMSLIRVGDSWVFYALTSAAKGSEGGDNPFTEALAKVIRDLKPHVVVTGSMSRLVRHEHHVSNLVKAFTDVKPILECAERVLYFGRDPNAGSLFIELATHAIRDRTFIVSRLETGRIAATSRGLYPFPEATLPIGYKRGPDRRIVLGEPRQQAAVRRAFQLLADPTVSMDQVAAVLVASQAFETRKKGSGGSERHALNHKLAQAWVRRLVDRVDTWDSGVHVMRVAVNTLLPDVVALDEAPGPSQAQYTFELPVPEGGWATAADFAAVRQRRADAELKRHRLRQTSPERHTHQLPLAGFRWRVGTTEYALWSRSGGPATEESRYMLVARPVSPRAWESQPGDAAWSRSLRRGWGSPTTTAPEFQCLISATVLHRSVARSVGELELFEFEESADILNQVAAASVQTAADTQREELFTAEKDLHTADLMRKHARELFYRTELDDPMHAVYEADYAEAVETVARISAKIKALRVRAEPPPSTEPLSVKAGSFLAALARLHEVPGPLPQAVVKALHAVFSQFTVTYNSKRGEATWSLRLRVLTTRGLGERLTRPLTGQVPIIPARRSQISLAHREEAAMRQFMERDVIDARLRAFALDGLKARGVVGHGIGHALLSAPRDVRGLVIAHLLDEPTDLVVDAAYKDLLLEAYVGEVQVAQRVWNLPAQDRQEVLDVLAHQGPLHRPELKARVSASSTERTFDALIRSGEGTWLGIAVPERYFVGASNNAGQRVRVRCRTCPHCGARVDIVARVPECPAGLLCSACLRMPLPDSPEFPESYRKLAARPQARRYSSQAEPEWWASLRRAHDAYPSAPITTLAASLGRERHEIKAACEALGLPVKAIGTIGQEWTDDRLRQEFLDRNRKLVDLAFEIGVSTGTLSKRLRSAGITKYTKRAG